MSENFNPLADLGPSLPLLFLLITGLVLMLLDAFKASKVMPYVTGAGLVVSGLLALPVGERANYSTYYNNMIGFGGFASMIHILLCVTSFFSLFFVEDYLARLKRSCDEVYSLMVFATIGMVMLATSTDLVLVFIGLEIMSVCLYIMAGSFPRRMASNEAALKYFLLGAFATGFLLYGISLIYGLSGIGEAAKGFPSTNLNQIASIIPQIGQFNVFYIAVALVLIGFFFKIAAFPFHSWTPDVYTGAPTPLVGFMATGSKMAAFIAFAMFLRNVLPLDADFSSQKITFFISLLAVASMMYGNIVAVQQTNIKRVFAYSSIAHSGYVMLGLCAGEQGYVGVVFYMLIYSLMTIGTFGIISMLEHKEEDASLENWRGLGLRYPWIGIAMSAFLFSLAGIPPLAGFMGKYFIFGAAIQKGLYWQSIIGILTSVIGAYYYIRIIVVMYFQQQDESKAASQLTATSFSLPLVGALLLVGLILLIGVFPSFIKVSLDNFFSTELLMSSSR